VTSTLLAVAAAASLLATAHAQQEKLPAEAQRSVVYVASDSQAIEQLEEQPAVTRRMVDRLVIAATQQPDLARAWRSLVSPADRVGIKVSAAGGRYFASHHGIVEAIAAGLEQAGVPRTRILIWDRDAADLRDAGFLPRFAGCEVRAIDRSRGYDRENPFIGGGLGRLIWGDVLFREKKRRRDDANDLSSKSFLAAILTREVTKIINVPVFADEAGCGISGALYNVTVPNVDNWRRFTQAEGGAPAGIAGLYADPRIGPKVVLHIMDGLLAQYAGGPRFAPNYAFEHHTIYASKDPVAIDATALRLIESWRKMANLPPIGARGEWLEAATEMGLGNFASAQISLEHVAAGK
jgi:Domain of unknown function (DUF362)